MSIHLCSVSTYPCFILYIVSTQDLANDIIKVSYLLNRYPLQRGLTVTRVERN